VEKPGLADYCRRGETRHVTARPVRISDLDPDRHCASGKRVSTRCRDERDAHVSPASFRVKYFQAGVSWSFAITTELGIGLGSIGDQSPGVTKATSPICGFLGAHRRACFARRLKCS
jgi:hypothetical protein